jgi:hypothetical protein
MPRESVCGYVGREVIQLHTSEDRGHTYLHRTHITRGASLGL